MMTPSKFLSTACPQTREAALTMIPIERLSTGVEIAIPGYDAVEVLECTFDGSGYSITVCTNARYGWDAVDHIYVDAGGVVEPAGEPRWMRPESAVTHDEWRAKADAISADTDRLLGKINAAQGYVPKPIDERPLINAVAQALGLSGSLGSYGKVA